MLFGALLADHCPFQAFAVTVQVRPHSLACCGSEKVAASCMGTHAAWQRCYWWHW